MFQSHRLIQNLSEAKRADQRRDHRDTRINEARHAAGIRIGRPLVRFLSL